MFMEEPGKISAQIRSVAPPIKRYLDMSDASEMQIKDVDSLLEDYKRLANLLNELASQDSEPAKAE